MPVFPLDRFPDAIGRFELASEQLHHLRRVLRVKPGENFTVSLPDGTRGQARLEKSDEIWLGIWQPTTAQPAISMLPVWLGIGILKMSRLEWLVEKSAELGLERLSLLQLSQGGFAKNKTISLNKINRLNKISQETLKQCERNASTRIEAPQSLKTFLQQVSREVPEAEKWLLRERSSAPLLPKILKSQSGRRVFLVGPEGGFSAEEIQLAEQAGFQATSLGPLLLRSETAALAALSYVHLRHAEEGKNA